MNMIELNMSVEINHKNEFNDLFLNDKIIKILSYTKKFMKFNNK